MSILTIFVSTYEQDVLYIKGTALAINRQSNNILFKKLHE